jgi:II/X family phage/plasmid replication protein
LLLAVDTVRLRSCYISEELAVKIENESFQRMGVDLKTMTLAYTITTGELTGSYDNRISIMVKRKEWSTFNPKGLNAQINTRVKKKTILSDSRPYIEIEASVHKLFMGHNIYGGTENFKLCCKYLIHTIEQLLEIELPYFADWTVKRIDFAYVFNLMSMEAVNEFFYLMKNSYYPRRSTSTFGLTGLQFNASTSVVKFYHKGTEFRIHDFKLLKKKYTEEQLFELLTLASGLLRVEIELKSRKLKYDFEKGQLNDKGEFIQRYGHEPFVKDITEEYLQNAYEVEVNRIMKEGKKKGDITRDSMEVEKLLYSLFDNNKASILFSAWLKIINFGLQKYKDQASKATYYRHLKDLKEAGISINLNNDVNAYEITKSVESLLPRDFQPLRDDDRRLVGEDETVLNALKHMETVSMKKAKKKNIPQKEDVIQWA